MGRVRLPQLPPGTGLLQPSTGAGMISRRAEASARQLSDANLPSTDTPHAVLLLPVLLCECKCKREYTCKCTALTLKLKATPMFTVLWLVVKPPRRVKAGPTTSETLENSCVGRSLLTCRSWTLLLITRPGLSHSSLPLSWACAKSLDYAARGP